MRNPARPESTYRIQFHAEFTFRDAAALVPYLAELGVSHLYASPYLKATPGSTHGYDVIDHCTLNPELGTEEDFEALVTALAANNMSHILDVVPNHVGIATNHNKWWNSVLAEGPDSKYGKFFDIAWDGSPRPELQGKVLLPLLGSPYNDTLEKGELTLSYEEGSFWINYFKRRFPISAETLKASTADAGSVLARMNGKPGDPRSFDEMHALLERQHYRLAYWKNASDEINYRRFFDVNDLAALAMERRDVFEETHALVFRLIAEGKVTGLRIDHPDGLYDPAEYFKRLQDKFRETNPCDAGDDRPLYLLAEKILAYDEELPVDWKIDGTSGYDFLNMTNGLFIDAKNEPAFSRIYDEWLGEKVSGEFETLIYEKKKLMLQIALTSELHMLAHRMDRLAQRYRGWRDFTLKLLMSSLGEVIASFSVYRTYIDGPEVSKTDQMQIERAIEAAIKRNPRVDVSVFHFIRDVLLQRYPDTFSAEDRAAQLAFARKFQQLTSPTTAKGIEDTSFYIYNRFVSLNEVGGDPARFGVSPAQVHSYFAERQKKWPTAMSTLSTHDTKRSEDVRARLNVLSELPDDWESAVARWRRFNQQHKTIVDGMPAPDANDEYLLYQTLLAAWPLESMNPEEYQVFGERIQAYMLKSIREAKTHTIWTSPNQPYHDATEAFVSRLLHSESGGEFLQDFASFRKQIVELGLINSLSQTLLKLTAPGVPDTYQGTELWDFSLVDPDNRRPVDFLLRQKYAKAMPEVAEGTYVATVGKSLKDGRAKLLLICEALRLRRLHPELFAMGEYVPVAVEGDRADQVFCFLRKHAGATVLVAVPRLQSAVRHDSSGWGNTKIIVPSNSSAFKNVFTGTAVELSVGRVDARELFAEFPVYLAISE